MTQFIRNVCVCAQPVIYCNAPLIPPPPPPPPPPTPPPLFSLCSRQPLRHVCFDSRHAMPFERLSKTQQSADSRLTAWLVAWNSTISHLRDDGVKNNGARTHLVFAFLLKSFPQYQADEKLDFFSEPHLCANCVLSSLGHL